MYKIFGTDLIIISRIELYLLSYIRINISQCLSCIEILCKTLILGIILKLLKVVMRSVKKAKCQINGICNPFKKWGKIDIYY